MTTVRVFETSHEIMRDQHGWMYCGYCGSFELGSARFELPGSGEDSYYAVPDLTGARIRYKLEHLQTPFSPPPDATGVVMKYEIRIVDEQGRDVPVGEAGEIVARSDRVMKGYWKAPEETAETIKSGWLYTGDVGRMDEDGYIYIVDRKKDMIISGGENIYSREVEEVLYMHPAILEAAVVGVPDEKWGESVKAVVVLKQGASASEEELIDFCREYLASYKKPRSVEFWDSLPRTGSGKVRKNEIRERYWEGYEKRVH